MSLETLFAFFAIALMYVLLVLSIAVLIYFLRKAGFKKREFVNYYTQLISGIFGGIILAIALEMKGATIFSLNGIIRFIPMLLVIVFVGVIGFWCYLFVDRLSRKTKPAKAGR